MKVVTEKTPWPEIPIRRASVNSFGYGGANAHCVLDHVSSVIPRYHPLGQKKDSLASLSVIGSDSSISSRLLSTCTGGIDARQSTSSTNKLVNDVSTEIPKNLAEKLANDSVDGANCMPYQDPRNGQDCHRISSQLMGSTSAATRRLVLLPFTGHDEISLKKNITVIADVVDTYHLSDLAYTLASRRSNLSRRAFGIVDARIPSTLHDPSNARFGKSGFLQQDVGFIFTGNFPATFPTCP